MVRAFPTTAQDEALGHASAKFAQSMPAVGAYASSQGSKELLMKIVTRVDVGRSLSNHNHAALEYLSSKIHDAFRSTLCYPRMQAKPQWTQR